MDITFALVEGDPTGKRAVAVAKVLDRLAEAGISEPVPFEELVEGIEHPHQYTPALVALELVGVVRRWEYTERGKRRTQYAYSLEGAEIVD